MPRRILVALSNVPTFDMFRYEGHMYRRQQKGRSNRNTDRTVLATPAYREPNLKTMNLPPDTRVEWVSPH